LKSSCPKATDEEEMTIEVRDFAGDAAALSAFVVAGWRANYQSSGYVPVWTADYFRWQLPSLAADHTEGIVAAYERGRLVGVYPSEVVPIRIRGEHAIATMSSWLTVDPGFLRAGIGRAMLDEVRRFNQKVGGIFNCGFVNEGAGKARVFWTASAGQATMFKRPRMWVRVLDWSGLSQALWSRLDKASAFVAAMMGGPPPTPADGNLIFPYQPTHLDSCHALFQQHMRGFDLEYCWDRNRLAHHLGFGSPSRTLVLASPSAVEGYANFHILDAHGRNAFRFGIVEFVPARLPQAKAVALLNAVLATMRNEGVALVMLLGPPVHRQSVLLRCGFLPTSTYKLICIEMKGCPPLGGLQRIYTHLR
jgi:GNAT superfamily N-acetyltransferase